MVAKLFKLLILVGFAGFVSKTHAQPSALSSMVGQPFPSAKLRSLIDGTNVEMKSFSGRPTFVFFWATWCGYCMEKLPEVKMLAEHGQKHGYKVVGVNY